ncbi:HAD family hydrolase [Arenibacterium halophilum]|uniref:phosphoglycolate phosphatase n=1 Tax=Arenibacterium halophilum TaxID=2583821 RepID=A0ABY2X9K7_9RHOB|nr:HAD family hydrolase [Arenibacterium halophilum]TMV12728.1 HAD family hydrolase [Arenibacterium halophilum]
MTIKAIVFDKDGTLFDFSATWVAWAESFLSRLAGGDRDLTRRLGQRIGFDTETRRFLPGSVAIADTPPDIVEALLPLLPGMPAEEVLALLNSEAEAAPQVEAVPLARVLGDLRARGLRLGVATNDAEVPARAHITSAGVGHHFEFVAGSDSGHGAKPAPGQLLAFASYLRLAPGQIAMVGDSCHDLAAGRAAGMSTIGVLTGMAGADELTPLADVILPDIGHIAGWLDR